MGAISNLGSAIPALTYVLEFYTLPNHTSDAVLQIRSPRFEVLPEGWAPEGIFVES